MKSLYDYDILVNDVFYRSEHILSYLERHSMISMLDKEAIENTILDALVDNGLMDKMNESLDLDKMVICNNLEHTRYQESPNVTSIPLNIKEAMRHRCMMISASIPLSVFYAKPSGRVTFCIYDMNTALSVCFSHFSFLEASYNSPTRDGVRVMERPFLEVDVRKDKYLIDALTKRMFKSSWFKEKYNLVIDRKVSSDEFSKEQIDLYKKQTEEIKDMALSLSLSLPFVKEMRGIPKQEEFVYEMDKSREYYPAVYEEIDKMGNNGMMEIFNLLSKK